MIGIIGAMDVEVDLLKQELQQPQSEMISGIEFVRGRLNGQEVVIARCGVGKVFAAICAQTMILCYAPRCIINTGVGGTLCAELSIGDIAVAESVVQYDMDTSSLGDPVGLISGINRIYFPTDETIRAYVQKVLQQLGTTYRVGNIASGDRFLCDAEKKAQLHEQFGAIACEMEGGAIGQVCFVNQVPFLILRAISDGADDASNMDYPTFVKMAAGQSEKVLFELVSQL